MTIDIRSLGYVRVAATDVEAWRTFAGTVLGLAVLGVRGAVCEGVVWARAALVLHKAAAKRK